MVVSEAAIQEGDYTIGRAEGNTLQIEDGAISGNHAVMTIRRSPYMRSIFDIFIKDLGSTNGTYVNKLKVKQQRLNHGDQISIGTHEFKIFDDQAGEGTQTEFYVPEA